MKNIIVTTALLALFTLSVAGASSASSHNGVREKIQKEISYPDFAKETKERGFVLIGFTLDSLGRIEVNGINTNNPVLGKYVESKILEISFEELEGATGDYAIRIDFELM